MYKDFYIKNMVCNRCIKVLKNEAKDAGIRLKKVELGRLKINISEDDELKKLNTILEQNGFELIHSTEDKLTETVKIVLINMLDDLPIELQQKLSDHLAHKLSKEYSKISKIFSFTQGITIEKYFIKLKIEKVKELIQSQELNFTEIGQLLDYSNANHLSRQFKNETGMSLSQYKDGQLNFRNSLDQIV